MASKRGRKKERQKQRQRSQAQRQEPLRQPPMPPASLLSVDSPEPPDGPSGWERLRAWANPPRWAWVVLVFLATVITLLEGYPWLSVEEGPLLDPNNAYSELFLLKNDGYIPITDLRVICAPSFLLDRS